MNKKAMTATLSALLVAILVILFNLFIPDKMLRLGLLIPSVITGVVLIYHALGKK